MRLKPTTIAKKYLFVLFGILLALQTFSATGFAAKESETVAEAEVVFHYQAASQDTREWQLWVWNEAGGESVTFDAADDFGMLATVKLPKETSKIKMKVNSK